MYYLINVFTQNYSFFMITGNLKLARLFGALEHPNLSATYALINSYVDSSRKHQESVSRSEDEDVHECVSDVQRHTYQNHEIFSLLSQSNVSKRGLKDENWT